MDRLEARSLVLAVAEAVDRGALRRQRGAEAFRFVTASDR